MLVNIPMSYSVVRPIPLHRPTSATVVTRVRGEGARAWPVLLFCFVFGMFGGVLLMKSSFGHSPAAQQLTKQIRALVR